MPHLPLSYRTACFPAIRHGVPALLMLAGLMICLLCGLRPGQAVPLPQNTVPVTTVSAASYASVVTPESIVAAFGVGLATEIKVATTIPLPTSLAGTTVRVNGEAAPLFFVAPQQINYLIPAGTPPGTATVTVTAGDGKVSTGTVQIAPVAPALFTADASGSGPLAAQLLRVKANGQLIYEPLAQNDGTKIITRPFDFGEEGDQLFLVLYLTGVRQAATEGVRVSLGGVEYTPLYAGASGGFVGLDQINVELPRSFSGRGKIALLVKATGSGGSNSGELEIASGAAANALMQITGLSSSSVLASDELEIGGTGFAANPRENQVQIVADDGVTTKAEVLGVSGNKLRVRVPFGVGTGNLRVSRGQTEASVPISVRSSMSGFVESTARQPLANVTVRLLGGPAPITAKSNIDGSFVLPDVAPGAAVLVEFDGGTTQVSPPYPKVTLKLLNVRAGRDNQFKQPIAIQQGATQTPASAATGQSEQAAIQDGNLVFDLPPGAVVQCPDGTSNCTPGIAQVSGSRTPENLPNKHFSSVIAQLTPFGAKFTPGGKLTFPNTDNLPAGSQATLFKFDQTANSATLGTFIAAGTATVSADGQRVESPVNAITEGSYYFVSIERLLAAINGRVVESDGRGVPRAIVRTRGQSTFTDGFGGFVLRDVPVLKASGDKVKVEVSYQRPNGRVARKDSAEVELRAGTLATISAEIVLDPAITNTPPIILAPSSLALNAGETRDFDVIAIDPDSDQPIQVAASGTATSFTTLGSQGQGVYRLHMIPAANAAGSYTLNVTATDAANENTAQSIAVTVNQSDASKPVAQSQSVTLAEDTTRAITLTGTDAGGKALSYTVVNQPLRGSLGGTAPNLTYTPVKDYNGADSFTFKVSNGSAESSVATVFIAVSPVNDAPVLSVPGPQSVNAGATLNLIVSATDVDEGQTLTFTAMNLPDGATFTQAGAASWQMNWTPTFAQARSYTVTFKVTDNGNPALSQSKDVQITTGVLWAKTSGPEGGRLGFLYSRGNTVFAGSAGGLLRSTDDGRSWTDATEGLKAVNTSAMTQIGTALFVSTVGGGVHRSANSGNTWEQVNTGLTDQTLNFVFASGDTLFAGTFFSGKVFRSTNLGNNWTEISTGLTQGSSAGRVNAAAVNGSALFIATSKDGIFRADLNGNNWTPVRTGLPQLGDGTWDAVRNLAVSNGVLYAGTAAGGVFRSVNNGDTWAAVNTGLVGISAGVNGLVASGTTVYAATFLNGVFKLGSNDTWTRIGKGLPQSPAIEFMAINGSSILIGEDLYGVFRSTDLGENFALSNSGLNILNIGGIYSDGQTLYVSGEYGAMFRSTNNGDSMTLSRNGLPGLNFKDIAAIGTTLFVGSSAPIGVYRSTDQGQNWTPANNGIANQRLNKLLVSGNTLYAAGQGAVFRTTDLGANWTSLSNGISNYAINCLTINGTTLFLGTDSSNIDRSAGPGILRSTDGGTTWTPANTGIARRGNGTLPSFFGLAVIGNTLYAGAVDGNGVYRSTDNGDTWAPARNGLTSTFILALVANGSTLFAADNGNGIYRSDDGANTWARFEAGLKRRTITSIAAQGNTIFAGGFGGILRATPNIQSWSETNSGLGSQFINAVTATSGTLYAGTLGNGIFRSTSQGQNWTAASTGLPANSNVQSVVTNGSSIFAGLFGDGVYRSGDQGQNWAAVNTGLTNKFVNKLFISGSTIYAGTDGGVFRSTDGGATWAQVSTGLGNLRVISFTANAGSVYAGTDGSGVFRLNAEGTGWTQINQGLTNREVTALFVSGALYAGTSGGVFISRDGGENWTAVNNNLPPTLNVFAFAASGKKVYAGSVYGVFVTEDEGQSWKQVNAGLLETYVTGLTISGNTLFAGTLRGGVFVSQIPASGGTF